MRLTRKPGWYWIASQPRKLDDHSLQSLASTYRYVRRGITRIGKTIIADDLVWELPYAPSLGHPARMKGRKEVAGSCNLVLGGGRRLPLLRFQRLSPRRFGRSSRQFRAEGRIKSTGRTYAQSYVLFLSDFRRKDHGPTRIFRSCPGLRRLWKRQVSVSNPEGKITFVAVASIFFIAFLAFIAIAPQVGDSGVPYAQCGEE